MLHVLKVLHWLNLLDGSYIFVGHLNPAPGGGVSEELDEVLRTRVICSLYNGMAISYPEQTKPRPKTQTGVGLQPPEPGCST